MGVPSNINAVDQDPPGPASFTGSGSVSPKVNYFPENFNILSEILKITTPMTLT